MRELFLSVVYSSLLALFVVAATPYNRPKVKLVRVVTSSVPQVEIKDQSTVPSGYLVPIPVKTTSYRLDPSITRSGPTRKVVKVKHHRRYRYSSRAGL